jgi:hypothetical protein
MMKSMLHGLSRAIITKAQGGSGKGVFLSAFVSSVRMTEHPDTKRGEHSDTRKRVFSVA